MQKTQTQSSVPRKELNIPADNPLAVAVVKAIQEGDVAPLKTLVQENPGLTTAKFGTPGKSRSMLHMATDWPGHFPNVASVITLLIKAGADPNAWMTGGRFSETPLPW